MNHRILLENTFSGPMDLLLYLVKRDEIDIHDIPIAHLTREYLAEIERMPSIDVDLASEFMAMASVLVEIKSRMLLPPTEPVDGEEDEDTLDPRAGLVKALLEYKRFKEIAAELGKLADDHANRFARLAPAFLPIPDEPATLDDLGVMDLFAAFQKMVRTLTANRPREIVNDEVPTEVRIQQIATAIQGRDRATFTSLLSDNPTKGEMVGFFIALLEMIRLRQVVARQSIDFSEIHLYAPDAVDLPTPTAESAPVRMRPRPVRLPDPARARCLSTPAATLRPASRPPCFLTSIRAIDDIRAARRVFPDGRGRTPPACPAAVAVGRPLPSATGSGGSACRFFLSIIPPSAHGKPVSMRLLKLPETSLAKGEATIQVPARTLAEEDAATPTLPLEGGAVITSAEVGSFPGAQLHTNTSSGASIQASCPDIPSRLAVPHEAPLAPPVPVGGKSDSFLPTPTCTARRGGSDSDPAAPPPVRTGNGFRLLPVPLPARVPLKPASRPRHMFLPLPTQPLAEKPACPPPPGFSCPPALGRRRG